MDISTFKKFRVVAAVIFIIAMTLLFLDISYMVPPVFFHVTLCFQFIPSLFKLINGFWIAAFGFFFVTALTILSGRVYCSVICPLGIMMDAISRLKKISGYKETFSFSTPYTFTRYSILILTIISVISGSLLLIDIVDPFSNYGRILTHIARPVFISFNNIISKILEYFQIYIISPFTINGLQLPVLLFTLFFLTIVFVFTVKGGRKYCNMICPVGTLLGIISRFSVYKITIDSESCVKCNQCEDSCKSECIDVSTQKIEVDRCVSCFNCFEACTFNAISYKKNSKNNMPGKAKTPTDRRSFLVLMGCFFYNVIPEKLYAIQPIKIHKYNTIPVIRVHPITPPGSISIKHFTDFCTSCHTCVSACPSQVLQPSFLAYGLEGVFMPQMNNRFGYCNYKCTACGDVCPTGAIFPLSFQEKRTVQIGSVKFIRDNCIVILQGTECGACAEHCPTKAVSMVLEKEGLRVPQLNVDICIGCGACEYICPAKPHKSIYVEGNVTHKTSKLPEIQKKVDEKPLEDFPF